MRQRKLGRWAVQFAVVVGMGAIVAGGTPAAHASTVQAPAATLQVSDLQPSYVGTVKGDKTGGRVVVETPSDTVWT
jgi:hypothetical protein